MKRVVALVACALSCLSAHATLGYVSYDVNVSPTFGGSPSRLVEWANLPLFNTSEFVGARLYGVTIEVTSTVEVRGAVNNSIPRPQRDQPVVVTLIAGETIDWWFKPPGLDVTRGVTGLTQTDGVTETFTLKPPLEGPDSQPFDLFDTQTSSFSWSDSAPNFDAFTTDGTSTHIPTMSDYFLAACSTGQSSYSGVANVQFGAPKCSATVTYNYIPEPGGVTLAAAALLAGGWVRRRRGA